MCVLDLKETGDLLISVSVHFRVDTSCLIG